MNKQVSKVGRLLYSVIGETEGGEEKALVIANDESEAAQFARTKLEFETVTAIHLEDDCVYV